MTQVPSGSPRCHHLWLAERVALGPHLIRLWLRGEALALLPADCAGAHVKLMFPQPGEDEPQLPHWDGQGMRWADPTAKPWVRTYTIAAFDGQRLAIDFVRHTSPGPAANWAAHAPVGARLGFGIPGPALPWLALERYQLLGGDLTALPMLSALLARLPQRARGEAWISVPSEADRQPLVAPPGIRLHWLTDTSPAQSAWSQALTQCAAPGEPVCVTLAGEAGALQQARRHLKGLGLIARPHSYTIPFWQLAHSEEGFHAERHRLMDAALAEDLV
ncbi:siderophore-interacting protein [Pseudaeromonas sp. ZJS20]|uniref:siderophore-interacting protein n=1 Tax=Pseudaeromonas aegiceratis TaxID=3153928 RepID=UPI00390C9DCD